VPKPLESATTVHDLSHLHPGAIVQARLPGTLLVYDGEVETVVSQHGYLWIRHGALKERKLITACDYDIFTYSSSVSASPLPE